jgi:DNA (cytosine-5)-methyltransferase 1
MRKPRLLDLFCGAGGCAKGYQRAGFHVTGVDIDRQPNYCGDAFEQADAMTYPLHGFDAYHASPPCQGYTTMNNRHGSAYPLLIAVTRERLRATGKPWVLENVPGALRWMLSPTELTGEMFGLGVHRPPKRPPRQTEPAAVYGKQDGRRLWTRTDGTELRVATLERGADAMGIDWMDWDELREAVPPAYTEYIGHQLLAALDA